MIWEPLWTLIVILFGVYSHNRHHNSSRKVVWTNLNSCAGWDQEPDSDQEETRWIPKITFFQPGPDGTAPRQDQLVWSSESIIFRRCPVSSIPWLCRQESGLVVLAFFSSTWLQNFQDPFLILRIFDTLSHEILQTRLALLTYFWVMLF